MPAQHELSPGFKSCRLPKRFASIAGYGTINSVPRSINEIELAVWSSSHLRLLQRSPRHCKLSPNRVLGHAESSSAKQQ
jgi:hypothetical protein